MTQFSSYPILDFENIESFVAWLESNFENSKGIWMKIFKKGSGIQSINYAEALDVALCYGWIDGQKQKFDEHAWLQKFCPRRPNSIWSKVNIGHVERLIKEKRMKPSGYAAIEKAKADGRWESAYDSQKNMTIPEDFLTELSKNPEAEAFFKSLNKTNLYTIGFKLQTAKKIETRAKRMREIIEKLSRNEKFH